MTLASKSSTLQKVTIYSLAIILVVIGTTIAVWGVLFTVLIGPYSLLISVPALLMTYYGPNIIKTLDIMPHPNPVGRFFVELLSSLSFAIISFFSFDMINSAVTLDFTSIVTPVWAIPLLFFIVSLIRTFHTARKCKEPL